MKTQIRNKKQERIDWLNQYFDWVAFVVIIILIVIIYIFFLQPLVAKGKLYNDSMVKQKNEVLNKQKSVYKELIQLENIYKKKIDDQSKEKILDILPDKYDLSNLYYNIEKIINSNGYKLASISVNVPAEDLKKTTKKVEKSKRKKIQEINIEIELEGTGYIKFKKMLNNLEYNLRMLDVVAFNYGATQTKSNLTLKAYYYK